MKRKLFIVLFVFFFLPLQRIFAEDIQLFRSEYSIERNGTVRVTERIEYNFGSERRHGMFRNIPYIKTNEEGKQFRMNIDAFSVVNASGVPYKFTKQEEKGAISLKIGDPDTTVTGIQTYILNYTIWGGITYFSDHDELYWNATGNEWNIPILKAESFVILPDTVDPVLLQLACFTGSKGSTEKNCLSTHNGKEIRITAVQPLLSKNGLTFAVGFPKGMVEVVEPEPVVSLFDNPFVLFGLIAASFVWYIAAPIWLGIRWLKQGRDPDPTVGQAHVWFSIPQLPDKTPLTPLQLSFLLSEYLKPRAVTATIVDLAHKGFLTMAQDGKHMILTKTSSKAAPQDTFEAQIIEKIFAKGDVVSTKDIELFTLFQTLQKDIASWAVKKGLFVKNPYLQRALYTGISILALVTGNIPLLFSAYFFGMQMPKKTLQGANIAAMSRALKGFLVSQDKQYEFQAKEVMLFEKMLPFAVALGIETIWAKRFEHLHVPPPDWYAGQGTFSPNLFAQSLHSSFGSVQNSMTSTSSSSGFSSGFSGGSSGGGGGGGGGGSW